MTTGWVGVFDQSFQRVPISRLHEMYDANYRVMAGYAGGGSSDKWTTRAEIDAWFALGDDTGFAPLFEIVGDEPLTHPELGDDHARQARAAWRARGVADDVSISPAMDRNVTIAQGSADILPYFQRWTAADTCKPIAYVEADVGVLLDAKGASAGTFTPAAYGWNVPPVLYTPDNAPAHVIWTQEHNARKMAGGDIDVGHIRVTAPIWWKDENVALTQADANLVVATLVKDVNFQALIWRVAALLENGPVASGPDKGDENKLATAIAKIPTTTVPTVGLTFGSTVTLTDPEVTP